MKRFVSILLLLALLLGCLPVSVLAADGEGYFYFSAESEGLLVAPMKVSYTQGQSIQDALTAAGIRLGFAGGMLSTVNGTSGNYQWLPGDARLDQTPTEYFCIYTGTQRASIGDGWKALMQQMQAYTCEEADVQQAAKAAYEAAYKSYPGADNMEAQNLAAALETAVSGYKTGLDIKYPVTFSQFSGSEYSIYAVSEYGKRISADNGVLSLPNGAYTFYIYKDNKALSGSLTVNGNAQTINDLPAIPTDAWFDESAFRISTQSGSMSEADFESGIISTTPNGAHGATAARLDTFTGPIYPYVKLNSGVSGVSLSAIYTKSATGEETAVQLAAESRNTALYGVLSGSAKGNTVIFRASKTSGAYTLFEDFTLTLDRTLTLRSLSVKNAKGEQQPAQQEFSGTTMEYTYRVLNSEQTLDIYPVPAASDVTVTVNDKALNEAGYASVDITENQQIAVRLSAETYETTYTLTIERDTETTVKVGLGTGVTELVMLNRSGEALKPISTAEAQYTYKLIANETYTYRATWDTYFHAEKTFQLTDTWKTFTVNVPTDEMPSLEKLQVSTSKLVNQYAKDKLDLSPAFDSEMHEYTTTVADADGNIAAWAAPTADASCTVYYSGISKTEKDGTAMRYTPDTNVLQDTTDAGNAILKQNAYGNTLTFQVAKSTKDATGTTTTYSTDYVLTVKRALTLQNLEISGATLDKNFSGAEKNYTITVPAAQSALSLTATAWDNSRYNDADGGYDLFANDNPIASGETAEIQLSGDTTAETVTVTVKSRDKISDVTTYTISVQKAEGSKVVFNVQPTGALLYIFDKDSGSRVWPDETGSCSIFTGHTYGYSVTKQGYVGTSGYFRLENNQLVFGTIQSKKFVTNGDTHDITKPYAISLTPAPKSERKQLEAEWPSFRGNPENNGVTAVKTPISAEDGTLYWAVQAGNGYGSDAVGSPILVGGYLYTYAGTNILKVDKDTGAVLATGEMVGKTSFGIVPPTYAEGMILIGLADGCVQAFNADTLESLWVYDDPLGGQPNCPITVHDGYAYTGFWNSEKKDAAFVCLSLTDEDPAAKTESKPATWRHVQKGGFYWAGAYACDEFVMVGTDDGEDGYKSSTANLLLFEPKTGRLLDSKTNFFGDIRSSICYDKTTDAYYFTTKGGYFYSVKVSNDNKLTDLKSINLDGMSTSTPVVANGRAYVGVSGASQFGAEGHKIAVIDLDSNTVAYYAPTNGYPQTSGLLTTAYDGYNYVYFLDNKTPGTLRLLRDRKGQTAADATYQTKEDSGMGVYALFTPVGSQAQYAICSPIADENGTLYFKNDSGYLMAFGSAIDTLAVTKQPNKTHYNAGESFDAAGMTVTATYKNGLKRDVTKEISFKTGALEEDETVISLIYGSGRIMYHNERNEDGTMTAGVVTSYQTQVSITVGDAGGTVFGNLIWGYSSGQLTLSGTFPSGARLIAAAYDKDGRMTGTKLFTTTCSEEISGAKIKLFLLDSAGKPICEAVTAAGA